MNISLWILAQLKLSITLISIATWIWHFLLAIFSKFSQLSSGVGTLIFQGNSLSLQNQYFSIIEITREPGLMLFLSKTRTSIIHGCSIFHLSFNSLLFHFGSTISGQWTYFGLTIKVLPKPVLDGFNLFKSSFVIPKELSVFPPLLFFFSEFDLAWIV